MNMFQGLFVNLSLSPKQQELTAYLIIIPTNIQYKFPTNIIYGAFALKSTLQLVMVLAKTAISPIFFQFLEKLQKSQFLLDTLVPPLPLEFSNFSKNCDFSNFSQFLLLRANLDISLICNKYFRHQELGHRLLYVPVGLKDGYA